VHGRGFGTECRNGGNRLVAANWPGVDPEWSRTIRVRSTSEVDAPDSVRRWHVLDNGAQLLRRGLTPIGTLLCVHGNPTWSYLWRTLLSAGADPAHPWRVVAVDQLDMGYSERTGTFRRLADRINDLGDLTDALGLEGPVVTVGHDWGGVISTGWALEHPQLVTGVVLTNTAVHQPSDSPIPPALRLALHPAVHKWGTTTSDAFLRVTHSLANPPLPADVGRAFMAPYRGAGRRTGVGNFVADIPADASHPSLPALTRVAEGLRGLKVPALMLWGPRIQYSPIGTSRTLSAGYRTLTSIASKEPDTSCRRTGTLPRRSLIGLLYMMPQSVATIHGWPLLLSAESRSRMWPKKRNQRSVPCGTPWASWRRDRQGKTPLLPKWHRTAA